MLETLVSLMTTSQNPHVVDGAFNSVCKICEESFEDLANDPQKPLRVLVPTFLQFCGHPEVVIRKYALGSLNQLLHQVPTELQPYLDQFLAVLITLVCSNSDLALTSPAADRPCSI